MPLNQWRHAASMVLLAFMPFATSIAAEDQEEGWEPPPPTPEKFDWIQLKSDEWLKGESIAMYDRELEFDSDEMDRQTFDWDSYLSD